MFCKSSQDPTQQEPSEVGVQLWLILKVSLDLQGKQEPFQEGVVIIVFSNLNKKMKQIKGSYHKVLDLGGCKSYSM